MCIFLALEEKNQEHKELKKSMIMNSDTCAALNKDIESHKEKVTTLKKELTQASDKNEDLIKEMQKKEASITKLEKGNCYYCWMI